MPREARLGLDAEAAAEANPLRVAVFKLMEL